MKPDLLSIDDSNLMSSIVGEMSSGSKEAVLEWLSSSEARAGRLEQEAKVSSSVTCSSYQPTACRTSGRKCKV